MVLIVLITLCLDDLLPGDLEAATDNPRLFLLPPPDQGLVTDSLTLIATVRTILESENFVICILFYLINLVSNYVTTRIM